MRRYFFDVWDGDDLFVDDVGIELDDMEMAMDEARRALSDMMRDALRDTGRHTLSINIRPDFDGPVMLTITLTTVGPGRNAVD